MGYAASYYDYTAFMRYHGLLASQRSNMTLLRWEGAGSFRRNTGRDRDIVNMEWRKWPKARPFCDGYRPGLKAFVTFPWLLAAAAK